MEVSGHFHDPVTLPPGKESQGTRWIGGWVGPRAGLDAVAKGINPFIAPAGNRTPVVQPVA